MFDFRRDLSHNRFEGNLSDGDPATFEVSIIVNITINNNSFSGSLPSGFQGLGRLQRLYEYPPYLCFSGCSQFPFAVFTVAICIVRSRAVYLMSTQTKELQD